MNSKIRIFTYHNIKNPGAILFALSLVKLLKDGFETNDVKIVDYNAPRLEIYENLKRFKWMRKEPHFYNQRHKLWDRFLKKVYSLDKDLPFISSDKDYQSHFGGIENILVVGMDVWCLIEGTERPKFPNIFWLPEAMDAKKIAYGVSAYHSDLNLIAQNAKQLTKYLNDFDVIGARDQFTFDLALKYRTRRDGIVSKIPDPTMAFDIQRTKVEEKLISAGIDLDKPILGLLLFGEKELSRNIRDHYVQKGYQIVSPSMYNPFADFNLGHLLNPLEWADCFRFFSFCFTDRFHGSIYCIKNNTPFISLQKEKDLPLSQSKVYDLLSSFELLDCYVNQHDIDFDVEKFFKLSDEIEKMWKSIYCIGIDQNIKDMQKKLFKFNRSMKSKIFMD